MAKNELKRIGVLSMMKISAAIGFVFGLIYGGLVFLMFLFSGAMLASAGLEMEDAGGGGIMLIVIGLIVAIVAVIALTVIYAVMGAIWAIIYNLLAKMVGGVELELGDKR